MAEITRVKTGVNSARNDIRNQDLGVGLDPGLESLPKMQGEKSKADELNQNISDERSRLVGLGKSKAQREEGEGKADAKIYDQVAVKKVGLVIEELKELRTMLSVHEDMKSEKLASLDKAISSLETALIESAKKVKAGSREELTALSSDLDKIQAHVEQVKKNYQIKSGVTAEPAILGAEETKEILSELKRDSTKNVDELRHQELIKRSVESNNKDELEKKKKEHEALVEKQIDSLSSETLKRKYRLLDTFTDKYDQENESDKKIIASINDNRAKIRVLDEQIDQSQKIINQTTSVLTVIEANNAFSEGRTHEGLRYLAGLRDQGIIDSESQQALSATVQKSIDTLREQGKLTIAEVARYYSDSGSEKARTAVEESSKVSSERMRAADLVDQVQAKQTWTIVDEGKGSKILAGQIPYIEGRRQTSLKDMDYARLSLRGSDKDGEEYRIFFAPGGRKAWEDCKEKGNPILLKQVSTFRLESIPAHRGSAVKVKGNLNDSVVEATDIGYERDGTIFNSQGEEVDLRSHKNSTFIERQISESRAFSTAPYRPRGIEIREFSGVKQTSIIKDELHSVRLQSGQVVDGVKFGSGVADLITLKPPEGFTLVLNRKPDEIQLSTSYSDARGKGRGARKIDFKIIQREIDTVTTDDFSYVKIDSYGQVTERSVDGKKEEVITTLDRAKQTDVERANAALKALSQDEDIRYLQSAALSVQKTASHLQDFVQANSKGSSRDAFIEFARAEVKPLNDFLNDPETATHLKAAKQRIAELKKLESGIANSDVEKKLTDQIQALESFVKLVEGDSLKNIVDIVRDESRFSADNWKNFSTNELPVIAGSVAVAVAATTAVVMTAGAAGVAVVPLWGIAAAGATGGLIGKELSQEAMHLARQGLKSHAEGDTYYGARSLALKKTSEEKVFNHETGKFESITWSSVGSTYGKELATNFVTSFATMGVSGNLGGRVSTFFGNSAAVERLAATESGKKLVVALSKFQSSAKTSYEKGKWAEALNKAAKELPKEYVDELNDEWMEDLGSRMLTQLQEVATGSDKAFGQDNVAAVILGTVKGSRLNSNTITYTASDDLNLRQQLQLLKDNGQIVTDLGNGNFRVRNIDTGQATFITRVADTSNPGVTVSSLQTSTTQGNLDETVQRSPQEVNSPEAAVSLAQKETFSLAQIAEGLRKKNVAISEIVDSKNGEIVAIEILPIKNGQTLNEYAARMSKSKGVSLIYNPSLLEKKSAGALYDRIDKIIYLSNACVLSGQPTNEDYHNTLEEYHEQVHSVLDRIRDQGGRSRYFGGFTSEASAFTLDEIVTYIELLGKHATRLENAEDATIHQLEARKIKQHIYVLSKYVTELKSFFEQKNLLELYENAEIEIVERQDKDGDRLYVKTARLGQGKTSMTLDLSSASDILRLASENECKEILHEKLVSLIDVSSFVANRLQKLSEISGHVDTNLELIQGIRDLRNVVSKTYIDVGSGKTARVNFAKDDQETKVTRPEKTEESRTLDTSYALSASRDHEKWEKEEAAEELLENFKTLVEKGDFGAIIEARYVGKPSRDVVDVATFNLFSYLVNSKNFSLVQETIDRLGLADSGRIRDQIANRLGLFARSGEIDTLLKASTGFRKEYFTDIWGKIITDGDNSLAVTLLVETDKMFRAGKLGESAYTFMTKRLSRFLDRSDLNGARNDLAKITLQLTENQKVIEDRLKILVGNAAWRYLYKNEINSLNEEAGYLTNVSSIAEYVKVELTNRIKEIENSPARKLERLNETVDRLNRVNHNLKEVIWKLRGESEQARADITGASARYIVSLTRDLFDLLGVEYIEHKFSKEELVSMFGSELFEGYISRFEILPGEKSELNKFATRLQRQTGTKVFFDPLANLIKIKNSDYSSKDNVATLSNEAVFSSSNGRPVFEENAEYKIRLEGLKDQGLSSLLDILVIDGETNQTLIEGTNLLAAPIDIEKLIKIGKYKEAWRALRLYSLQVVIPLDAVPEVTPLLKGAVRISEIGNKLDRANPYIELEVIHEKTKYVVNVGSKKEIDKQMQQRDLQFDETVKVLAREKWEAALELTHYQFANLQEIIGVQNQLIRNKESHEVIINHLKLRVRDLRKKTVTAVALSVPHEHKSDDSEDRFSKSHSENIQASSEISNPVPTLLSPEQRFQIKKQSKRDIAYEYAELICKVEYELKCLGDKSVKSRQSLLANYSEEILEKAELLFKSRGINAEYIKFKSGRGFIFNPENENLDFDINVSRYESKQDGTIIYDPILLLLQGIGAAHIDEINAIAISHDSVIHGKFFPRLEGHEYVHLAIGNFRKNGILSNFEIRFKKDGSELGYDFNLQAEELIAQLHSLRYMAETNAPAQTHIDLIKFLETIVNPINLQLANFEKASSEISLNRKSGFDTEKGDLLEAVFKIADYEIGFNLGYEKDIQARLRNENISFEKYINLTINRRVTSMRNLSVHIGNTLSQHLTEVKEYSQTSNPEFEQIRQMQENVIDQLKRESYKILYESLESVAPLDGSGQTIIFPKTSPGQRIDRSQQELFRLREKFRAENQEEDEGRFSKTHRDSDPEDRKSERKPRIKLSHTTKIARESRVPEEKWIIFEPRDARHIGIDDGDHQGVIDAGLCGPCVSMICVPEDSMETGVWIGHWTDTDQMIEYVKTIPKEVRQTAKFYITGLNYADPKETSKELIDVPKSRVPLLEAMESEEINLENVECAWVNQEGSNSEIIWDWINEDVSFVTESNQKNIQIISGREYLETAREDTNGTTQPFGRSLTADGKIIQVSDVAEIQEKMGGELDHEDWFEVIQSESEVTHLNKFDQRHNGIVLTGECGLCLGCFFIPDDVDSNGLWVTHFYDSTNIHKLIEAIPTELLTHGKFYVHGRNYAERGRYDPSYRQQVIETLKSSGVPLENIMSLWVTQKNKGTNLAYHIDEERFYLITSAKRENIKVDTYGESKNDSRSGISESASQDDDHRFSKSHDTNSDTDAIKISSEVQARVNSIIASPKFSREIEKLGINQQEMRIQLVGKGRNSLVYKVDSDNRTVALRLNRILMTNERDIYDLGKEAAIAKELEGTGVLPRIYSQSRDFTIMEFIPGKPALRNELRNEKILREIVEKIKLIHSTTTPLETFDPLRSMLSDAALNSLSLDQFLILIRVTEEFRLLVEEYGDKYSNVNCHNDLSLKNILINSSEPVIVDFERIRNTSPFVDLAKLANCASSLFSSEFILKTYFGEVTPQNQDLLKAFQKMEKVRVALVAHAEGKYEESSKLINSTQSGLLVTSRERENFLASLEVDEQNMRLALQASNCKPTKELYHWLIQDRFELADNCKILNGLLHVLYTNELKISKEEVFRAIKKFHEELLAFGTEKKAESDSDPKDLAANDIDIIAGDQPNDGQQVLEPHVVNGINARGTARATRINPKNTGNFAQEYTDTLMRKDVPLETLRVNETVFRGYFGKKSNARNSSSVFYLTSADDLRLLYRELFPDQELNNNHRTAAFLDRATETYYAVQPDPFENRIDTIVRASFLAHEKDHYDNDADELNAYLAQAKFLTDNGYQVTFSKNGYSIAELSDGSTPVMPSMEDIESFLRSNYRSGSRNLRATLPQMVPTNISAEFLVEKLKIDCEDRRKNSLDTVNLVGMLRAQGIRTYFFDEIMEEKSRVVVDGKIVRSNLGKLSKEASQGIEVAIDINGRKVPLRIVHETSVLSSKFFKGDHSEYAFIMIPEGKKISNINIEDMVRSIAADGYYIHPQFGNMARASVPKTWSDSVVQNIDRGFTLPDWIGDRRKFEDKLPGYQSLYLKRIQQTYKSKKDFDRVFAEGTLQDRAAEVRYRNRPIIREDNILICDVIEAYRPSECTFQQMSGRYAIERHKHFSKAGIVTEKVVENAFIAGGYQVTDMDKEIQKFAYKNKWMNDFLPVIGENVVGLEASVDKVVSLDGVSVPIQIKTNSESAMNHVMDHGPNTGIYVPLLLLDSSERSSLPVEEIFSSLLERGYWISPKMLKQLSHEQIKTIDSKMNPQSEGQASNARRNFRKVRWLVENMDFEFIRAYCEKSNRMCTELEHLIAHSSQVSIH